MKFKLSDLLIGLLIIFCVSCRKAEVKAVVAEVIPQKGGLAITFDDYSVDNWFKYVNLLDSFKVKCTFYVSNYNKLADQQKEKLRTIQSHGHEIAFHSTNHLNFVENLQRLGFKKLMDEEVRNGLDLMNKDGFYPQTFAYPYGAHNLIMDKALLKRFKSIRTLNGTHELKNSLFPLSGNSVIRGLGIDENSKRNFENICSLLSSAKDLDKCAVLLIHNVERNDTKLQLPLSKLRNLLLKAKALNLHSYTISEISR